MGENGAGKSTLIRMLGGAHQPDTGEIRIEGKTVRLDSPLAAMKEGIGVIYQELTLIPALSVCDNLFLGRSQNRFWIGRTDEHQRAEAVFRRMGVQLPLDVPVRMLSIAQQQLVEIARVLAHDVRILVMDEPSAVLTPSEVGHLFAIIRELKSQGIGIIYISHRLEEVFEIADSVTVLRDGQHIADCDVAGLTRARLIELMVGRVLEREYQRQSYVTGTPLLDVNDLTRGKQVQNVSFSIRPGEILGLTGLVGAGRTETARLIFGADRADGGTIRVNGRVVTITSPREAIEAGICLLTEDRKTEALIPNRSVRENFSLASLTQIQTFGFLRRRQERDEFEASVRRLNIRITDSEQIATTLSGGNQQKLMLARWLRRDSQVFLMDEPTRGVDIGARQEIYQLIAELAKQGKAILLISSDLPEVLSLADRILVMRRGRISGEIQNGPDVTQEQIMELAAG
jgi:ABC-type sugar transport system ATPase subunit